MFRSGLESGLVMVVIVCLPLRLLETSVNHRSRPAPPGTHASQGPVEGRTGGGDLAATSIASHKTGDSASAWHFAIVP